MQIRDSDQEPAVPSRVLASASSVRHEGDSVELADALSPDKLNGDIAEKPGQCATDDLD
jgi:hypothetical protein